ncbi:MAG: polysaccharide deacetylase family protein [Cyclobacteriaceae bacterium]
MKSTLILLSMLLFCLPSFSQDGLTISEKLGYEKDARLLILHADDLGVAHSVNEASFRALASGAISSASIMVPCPWLLEVAAMAKQHPEFDLGLHLTITAEWDQYKWDGVSPSSQISSLLNDEGFMYDNTDDVMNHAKPGEVRQEIQAQIDLARRVGIEPTHLDSHMGALFTTPELFQVYVEAGKSNQMPVFVPRAALALLPPGSDLHDYVIPIEYQGSAASGTPARDWEKHYISLLDACKPGINEIIVHLGFDDDELQAVTVNHPDYGAAWRSLDLGVVESPSFRKAMEERNIKLVTYREIQNLLYGE